MFKLEPRTVSLIISHVIFQELKLSCQAQELYKITIEVILKFWKFHIGRI